MSTDINQRQNNDRFLEIKIRRRIDVLLTYIYIRPLGIQLLRHLDVHPFET